MRELMNRMSVAEIQPDCCQWCGDKFSPTGSLFCCDKCTESFCLLCATGAANEVSGVSMMACPNCVAQEFIEPRTHMITTPLVWHRIKPYIVPGLLLLLCVVGLIVVVSQLVSQKTESAAVLWWLVGSVCTFIGGTIMETIGNKGEFDPEACAYLLPLAFGWMVFVPMFIALAILFGIFIGLSYLAQLATKGLSGG